MPYEEVDGPWQIENFILVCTAADATRLIVAREYADLIARDRRVPVPWRTINEAILTRWARSGLDWIKSMARKMYDCNGSGYGHSGRCTAHGGPVVFAGAAQEARP